MWKALAIALVFALGGNAWAANLAQLRGEVVQSDARLRATRADRRQLESELGSLAAKIEALKSEKSGALFKNAELESLLQRSQALSSRLSELLSAERSAEQGLRDGQGSLVVGLDEEIGSLRQAWDKARSRDERQQLLPRIKALRAERESLRGQMPASLLPQVSSRPSDDPEELAERADALLDSEDKLRREEKALAARVQELKRERELERRMDEFLGEQSLFDEHDRRIATSRTAHAFAAAPAADSASDPAAKTAGGPSTTGDGQQPSLNVGGGNSAPPGGGTGGTLSGGTGGTTGTIGGAPNAPAGGGSAPSGGELVRSGVTRMPPQIAGKLSAYSDDETLEELEARQAQLRKLADQLHTRALEAERQARELR